jgi:hypothetical protein
MLLAVARNVAGRSPEYLIVVTVGIHGLPPPTCKACMHQLNMQMNKARRACMHQLNMQMNKARRACMHQLNMQMNKARRAERRDRQCALEEQNEQPTHCLHTCLPRTCLPSIQGARARDLSRRSMTRYLLLCSHGMLCLHFK